MDKELNWEIGMRIKEARENAHLTQEKLAEILDCSPQYVSHLETGRHLISIKMLCTLCRELNLSADKILFGNADGFMPSAMAKQLSELSQEESGYLKEIIRLFVAALNARAGKRG